MAMTGKERVMAALNGIQPDKVPHFELDFQISEEAFGIPRLPYDVMKARVDSADKKGREKFLKDYFEMWKMVVDRFGWAALCMPLSFYGHFNGEVIPRARDFFGDGVALYAWNGEGTYWLLPGDDMMEFTIRIFEDRAGLMEDAKRKCEASIELARLQVEQGVDFICINSDYAYNKGPFISPQMFSEIVTPFLTEIVSAIHELGSKAILHSDGDLMLILDQLVSTGLDGYQSVDPQGNMDIAEVRRLYPDLLLMGNVQTSLMQDVNEDLIRKSARYAIDSAKPGGRFIFSSSNCIFDGMPLKSYEIMLDEYEKLAWYTSTE